LNRYYYQLSPDWRRPNLTARKTIDEAMDFVWEANEKLRENTIPNYKKYIQEWFLISSISQNTHSVHFNLFVPQNRKTEVLIGVPQNIKEALWRFEFQGCRKINIIHWSGDYLDVNRTGFSEDENIVRVTPKNNSEFQKWSFWLIEEPYDFERRGVLITGEVYFQEIWTEGALVQRMSDGKILFINAVFNNSCLFDRTCTPIHFKINQPTSTYVNLNNYGFENGTVNFPWNTVKEGVDWILPGSEILIAPGHYLEKIVIDKECNLMRYGNSGSVIIGSN
jgi:hypothetical protein